MAQTSLSNTRKYLKIAVPIIDNIAKIGMQLGAIVFTCATIYLLWGIFEGSIGDLSQLPQADADRILYCVVWACKGLVLGGIATCICLGIRFRTDNVTGYGLLAGGSMLCWGLPVIVSSTIEAANIMEGAVTLYVMGSFKTVGITALAVAVPFILMDFWWKIVGVHRDYAKPQTAASKAAIREGAQKSLISYFCWQMPYCREHLRGHCAAFSAKKPCWLIKSGCYCDEDLLLRSMKKSPANKMELLQQSYSQAAQSPSQNLTAAQKRARCRQCFIYTEHQKQKYQLLSPFVFPLVAAVIWAYYTPIVDVLNGVMKSLDSFASSLSYVPVGQNGLANQWATSAESSEIAQWILLGCLGLMAASYLLRGLEYLIFDLQV